MRFLSSGVAVLLGAVLAAAPDALAQQAPPSGTAVVRDATTPLTTRVGRPFASVATSIVGWARAADNSPVPDATVRLRNVVSGRVEATTVTSASGEFSFADIEGGSYLLELVDDGGRILLVSPIFTVGPGESVATILRIAARQPLFANFFGNAATAVVTSAAGVGITAMAPQGERQVASPDDLP